MRTTEALTVTVPLDLKKQLQALAEREGRNLSNMVTVLLVKAVKKEEKAAYSR